MVSKTLGQKVKAIRWEWGMTQAELAKKAGVSIQTVWRIEHDKGEPYTPTLKVLAKALKVSLKEIAG